MPTGYKTCGGCTKSVGLRTRTCDCGWNFPAPKSKEVKAKEKEEEFIKALPITIQTVGEGVEPEPEPKVYTPPNIWGIAGKPPPYEGNMAQWLEEVKAKRPNSVITLAAARAHLGHATIPTQEQIKEPEALFEPV